ncbi:hypothetical protein C2W64_02780 [Brevibacillus laterosporus]|nr:RHS repeat-associated core domain-containing protein [Brevibacillus laterosporus]RAP24773.1 hypothetical protein C2W64_02780 [Brevibacillus laterosporus]
MSFCMREAKVKEDFEYDKSGNLATFKDSKGNTRKYTFTPYYEIDTMQVLSGKKVVETEKNTYDKTTRQLLTQQNNDTRLTYTYDSFLRPTSFTTFGRTYEQRYEDDDDTPDSIVYPDGVTTDYTYDNLGRMLSVKHPGMGKVTYDYDTSTTGDTVRTQYPNGTEIEKGFNSFGQTEEVKHLQANNNAWIEQNQYNGFGNLIETNVNQSASTFGYDKLDRIRKEKTPAREQTYTYDERGNRQSIWTAKAPSVADSSYTYDALNRLTTYTKNDKESTYTYYPGELRASKEADGKTTRYVYLNGHVIEELDDKNNLQARNIWGNELLYRDDVADKKQGYYYANAHGDIIEVKDKDGQTLNQYEYDLWGNVESKQEKMTNPFLYAGELYDEESGLIYLRARYYDPNEGRFITEDTYKGQVDNPLSLNRYAYVHNNPLRFTDPSGHDAWLVHGTWSDEKTWTKNRDNMVPYLKETFKEDIHADFVWSGDNSKEARKAASDKLVQEILEWRNIKGNEKKPIRLIAHSHGGNVSVLAINKLAEKGIKVDTLITIGTPVRKDYQLDADVRQHINVYNSYDDVQTSGGQFPDNLSIADRMFSYS